jgi:AAA+ ATPase superfamily predicted ATPase
VSRQPPNFIGRELELAALREAYGEEAASLILLSGRRRIGKSYLLQRFVEGRNAIFYQATRQAEGEELRSFTREVTAAMPGSLPPDYVFPTWEAALEFLDRPSGPEKRIVILDEFPYLCDTTPGLPSIVQRWWDRRGRTSRTMLILCGSAQTFMDDLDAGSAPLHQRFTGKISLEPLSYREAGDFFPSLSPADRVRVYSILGGTPLYLEQWRPARSLRENVLALFGDPRSALVDSAQLVLHTDLGDATAAYRVLGAVARGSTRRNEILQKARVTNERVLQRLEDLRLLAKIVPVTEGSASRRGYFAVKDPYFRFWFRFIEPNRAAIDRGLGERLIDDVVLPALDEHIGPIFEELAREFVIGLIAAGELPGLEIGSWWSTDGNHEIDIVAMAKKRVTTIGTVKWRAAPLGRDVYRNLAEHARALGVDESIPWLMIGRGGVEPELLRAEPHVRGYDIGAL